MDARPVVRRGSTGDAVRRLQEMLRSQGFDPGPVDGDFGARTEAAVRAFQQSRGLDADGVVGALTWAALGGEDGGDGDQVGDAGIDLIKAFEGFSADLYDDPAGHCTIGYGHLVHRGGCDGSEPEGFRRGISEERATEILSSDAGSAAATVSQSVVVSLSRSQRDALTSFTFNVGSGNFGSSTLLRLLNEGDYDSVPPQLNRWVYADGQIYAGLVRRRQAEGTLFRDGELIIPPSLARERPPPRPTVPPDGP